MEPTRLLRASLILSLFALANTSLGAEYAFEIKPPPEGLAGATFGLWVPDELERTKPVRGVIGVALHEAGAQVYTNGEWRKLVRDEHACMMWWVLWNPKRNTAIEEQAVAGPAILAALKHFAKATNRPELEHACLVQTGLSRGGWQAVNLASGLPERTICFVSYHGGQGDATVEPAGYQVPGLFLHGGNDTLVKDLPTPSKGRARDAPWTVAVQPDTEHHHLGSQDLSLLYVRTMFRLRLPTDIPKDRPPALRLIRAQEGWLGNLQYDTDKDGNVKVTKAKAHPSTEPPDDPAAATWLPDAEFSTAWEKFNATGQIAPGKESVSVEATSANVFTITRAGRNTQGLKVSYKLGGTAVNGVDYKRLPDELTIGWQSPQEVITLEPTGQTNIGKTVTLTLQPADAYTVTKPAVATIVFKPPNGK